MSHATQRAIKYKRAFTLVETLVAIAIISMTIIAPLTIASNGLTAATTGRDLLVATSLARDGIEVVRHLRDNNKIYNAQNPGAPRDWLWSLSVCKPDAAGPGCVVDSLRGSKVYKIITSSGTNTGPLRYNSSTGLYGHQTGTGWFDSKFTRRVVIDQEIFDGAGVAREARVTSTVSWYTIFTLKSVVLVEHINNW